MSTSNDPDTTDVGLEFSRLDVMDMMDTVHKLEQGVLWLVSTVKDPSDAFAVTALKDIATAAVYMRSTFDQEGRA